ncbi:hypothetical protein [Thiocapsa rosea]|nr:hypothetical protein [Thiocapsa rosea]
MSAIYVGWFNRALGKAKISLENTVFLLETASGASTHIAAYLAEAKADYYLFPHNIESLVYRGMNSYIKAVNQFSLDIRSSRGAKACFTISPLDTFILSALSAKAVTLPYYPVSQDVMKCQSIYSKRLGRQATNRLLFLGSVVNFPTREGTIKLISQFKEHLATKYLLDVVGYGTEQLRNMATPRIKVHGTLSDEMLHDLLVEIDAVVLYQPPTTGFLTRIVELNLSGVPVFLNIEYIAGCSLENYGVNIYRKLTDIDGMLFPQSTTGTVFSPPNLGGEYPFLRI